MAVTGGSAGGGADLDLVFRISGMGEVEEKYQDLAKEIGESKARMSEAEIKAAEKLRDQAARVAGEMEHAAELATGAGDRAELQERLVLKIFQDYTKMGQEIIDLRKVVKGFTATAMGEEEEEEEGEKPDKPEPKKESMIRKRIVDYINIPTQLKATLDRGVGMLSPTTLGTGGFFGLMFYGLSYEDKIRTDTERYTQLWSSTVAATTGPGFEKAERHARQLGQQLTDLTKTFRMSEGEARAVVNAMTQAGITAAEAHAKTSIVVGGAKQSVLLANAAVDQYFRLQEGTAGRTATRIMTDYGESSKAASERVAALAITGRDAGVGVQNFLNDIMTATGQVRQYGAVIDDTVMIASTLQENLEAKGLEHHFAGALAMATTGNIAAGMAGMSKGMQIVIAERMGLGQDVGAYFALQDAMYDKDKGPGVFRDMVVASVDLVRRGSQVNQAETAYALEALFPHMGAQGSAQLVEAVETLRNTNLSKEDRAKAEKTFNDVWAREQSRTEDWRVHVNEIMRGMSKVGFALFNLMTIGLAQIVLLIREAPYALAEFIGNLAHQLAVPLTKLGPAGKAVGGFLEREFGAMRKFDPASKADLQYIHQLRGQATAAGERQVQLLGKGVTEIGGGLAGLLTPASLGMQAMGKALGTPEELSRMAGLETVQGAITQGAGLAFGTGQERMLEPGEGSATTTVELDPGERMDIYAATRRGDMGAIQEQLAGEIAAVQPGVEADEIVVTRMSFEPRPGGMARLSLGFIITPRAAQRRQQMADLVKGGLHTVEGVNRQMAAEFTAHESELIEAFPLAGRYNPAWASWGAKGPGTHQALDIPAPYGTTVVAPATGVVTFAGRGRARPDLPQQSVYILDPQGYSHQLSHLGSVSVTKGQRVRAGQAIGVTGRAFRPTDRKETSPHLHYEVEAQHVKGVPSGQHVDIRAPIKGIMGKQKKIHGQ